MNSTSVVIRSLTAFTFVFVLVSCGGGGGTSPLPLVINTAALPPDGARGVTYPGFNFTATGGSPPLTWSEVGALPPGLVFSGSGLLSGTPTTIGTFLITFGVQDSIGQSATPENSTIEVL